MGTDIRGLLRREFQLDLIAYVVIITLLSATGLLVFMTMAGIKPPEMWLLSNDIFRTLATGLLLMVILYMVDQHRGLRAQLLQAHVELEQAQRDIAGAYDRLAFSHRAAEVMTSLAKADGLRVVLSESVAHFNADAAAVIGDDLTILTADGIDPNRAQSELLRVALETVRAGKPFSSQVNETGGGALAVPLRIRGELQSVVALWRHDGEFDSDQLEGLSLVARIIELGMENRLLLDEVRTQLSGTLRAMVDLVERRKPRYIDHSNHVAQYATAVGRAMGLRNKEVDNLRLAAMLQDIGMLEIPESIVGAPRNLTAEELMQVCQHAAKGAELARTARFDTVVQEAIASHHERFDGSGYPRGLKGDQIPLATRILAVCDSYVTMTSERPHRVAMSPAAALAELRASAGVLYDARVVREFYGIQSQSLFGDAPLPTLAPDPARRAEATRVVA